MPASNAPSQLDEPDDVCAVALINGSGDALLQLRDDRPGLSAAGMWVFPGGHAEPGEDLESCAIREFREETDYECSNLRWIISLKDAFGVDPVTTLHVFWDLYREGVPYVCREGQDLRFVQRGETDLLRRPPYLLAVWDIVREVALAETSGLRKHSLR